MIVKHCDLDVREKCAHGPLCYDFSPLDVLMKDAALLKALGVNTEKAHWTECDSKVYAYLQVDSPRIPIPSSSCLLQGRLVFAL